MLMLTENQIDQMIQNTWIWVEDAKERRGEDLPEASFELFTYMGASIRLKWTTGIEKKPSLIELTQAMKHIDFKTYREEMHALFKQIEEEGPVPDEQRDDMLQIFDGRDRIECALLAMDVLYQHHNTDYLELAKATLWQADAAIRMNHHEFFTIVPAIREARKRLPRNLDQRRFWWWFYIPKRYEYEYEDGHWLD